VIGKKDSWHGNSMEYCLRSWIQNPNRKEFKGLPLITSWGIWIARNMRIFEDIYIPPFQCASQEKTIFFLFQHSLLSPYYKI